MSLKSSTLKNKEISNTALDRSNRKYAVPDSHLTIRKIGRGNSG